MSAKRIRLTLSITGQADRISHNMTMTTQRATCWSITINNPTDEDRDNIAQARAKRWTVEGQLEKGEEGTPHYQLMVKTPQVRFSAVKAIFPRAHIEIAKSPAALAKYVNKEDTRVEGLPQGSSKYPSLEKTYGMFVDWLVDFKFKREFEGFDDRWSAGMFMTAEFWSIIRKERIPELFDECCNYLIEDGYFVEQWAVNPQIRGALIKFGKSIVIRHAKFRDEKISHDRSITNADPEEEVSAEVETYSAPEAGTPSPAHSC